MYVKKLKPVKAPYLSTEKLIYLLIYVMYCAFVLGLQLFRIISTVSLSKPCLWYKSLITDTPRVSFSGVEDGCPEGAEEAQDCPSKASKSTFPDTTFLVLEATKPELSRAEKHKERLPCPP